MIAITSDVHLLETLTATLIDSVNGYREAAENDRAGNLREFFLDCADERERAVKRLQEAARRLGGQPEQKPSLLGQAHQLWVGLRSALQDGDESAILDEVERGESYLQQKFEEVIKDRTVKGETRQAIEDAYQSVCRRFSQVRAVERVAHASCG